MNLLHDHQLAFVTVAKDAFLVNGKTYPTLRCLLHKAQKIRKFFRHGKLACYSRDATVSHAGAYCVFCDDRYRCQRKVRLSMLLIDGPRLLPIILDVNQGSFANLQALLDQLGNDLHRIPVTPSWSTTTTTDVASSLPPDVSAELTITFCPGFAPNPNLINPSGQTANPTDSSLTESPGLNRDGTVGTSHLGV